MSVKRILVAHPWLNGKGGGNAVAAWTLQALRDCCELSLATLDPIDYAALNRSWGTALREGDFHVHMAPPSYRMLLAAIPTPGALLETSLTMRLARNLDRQHRYDVLFGTQNEADFGRRGINYVHHPWFYLPRPEAEMRWYHRLPGALHLYREICRRLAHGTHEGLRRNLSLANSAFIAGRIREVHGVESTVLFPPVTSDFPDVPWEQRAPAVVGLGRMHGAKRWELAVQIVDEVRRRGHDLGLTLIGHRDDEEYLRRLQRLAATRPWLRIRLDLSRDELRDEVARHRYGIHAMEDEHFGIAPAELLRAGCLLFAHASGGPLEIIGDEPRLLFRDVNDGADALAAALRDPAREAALRAHLATRRELFSSEAFCAAVRDVVEHFAGNGEPRTAYGVR